jgi:hypothetical protein
MATVEEPKFHRLHYNFVAKRLRTHYPMGACTPPNNIARRTIEGIALEFAQRFAADSPDFDAPRFLDQCSPDPEIFPLSELWEEEDGN